jgi:hypothetical protein
MPVHLFLFLCFCSLPPSSWQALKAGFELSIAETISTSEASLGLLILLPPTSDCWGHRCTTPLPKVISFFVWYTQQPFASDSFQDFFLLNWLLLSRSRGDPCVLRPQILEVDVRAWWLASPFRRIFYLFTFQMLYPFPIQPHKAPIPSLSSCFYEGVPPPTYPRPPPCPHIPLHWGTKPSRDQGPLLPLMPNKAILCYIFSWSHGSLPCILLGWWFRPWELCLVGIIGLPMGFQSLSAPSVLSLTPPLGTPWSVQWLALSIHLWDVLCCRWLMFLLHLLLSWWHNMLNSQLSFSGDAQSHYLHHNSVSPHCPTACVHRPTYLGLQV